VIFNLITVASFAQQDSNARLKECIDQFEKSRAEIATFCAKVVMFEFTTAPLGKYLPEMKKHELEIVCDQISDQLLIARRFTPVNPAMTLFSESMFLLNGTVTHHYGYGGRWSELPNGSDVPCGNLLTMGGGFWPETRYYQPLHVVTENLHSWHSSPGKWTIDQSGSLITFRNPSQVPGIDVTLISFDKAKGYMPVAIEQRGGKSGLKILVQGKVKPVLFQGIWLPGTVSYVSNENDFLHLEIDWVSINQPLPEGIFKRDQIELYLKRGAIDALLSESE
jgi:hypothetical protein